MKGTDTIHVEEKGHGWIVGDKLVITPSDYSADHVDEVIIVELVDNYTFRIFPALTYDHSSEVHIIEGREIRLFSAVGLLSRNIIIQGDEHSEEQQFGVHTIAAHGGEYRIENVEIRHCGQAFQLGRYCTHVHHLGMAGTSYVRSNSIHHSFQVN